MFHARGFTLLEIVVVLALLGLVTALVAPSGLRMIESWRRASDVETALGSLSSLSARAHQSGRGLALDAGEVPGEVLVELAPELPEGWTVVLAAPLRVQANGACAATHGELRAGNGYVQPFELQAPFCSAVRAGSAAR